MKGRLRDYLGMLNGPVIVMLVGTFLTVLTYYMMFPFFAIYLKERMALTATAVAVVVAIFTGFRRQTVLLGGFLIDKFGHKRMFQLGLFLHVLSYAGFAVSHTYAQFLVTAAFSTLGGALTIPAVRTLMVNNAPEGRTVEALALRFVVYNGASLLGPALGSLVAIWSFRFLFWGCAIAYLLYLLLVSIFMEDAKGPKPSARFILREAVDFRRNQPAVALALTSSLVFFLTAQVSATIPIHLKTVLGFTPQQIAVLFSFSALLCVVLQTPVARYSSHVLRAKSLTIALLLLTFGLGTFPLSKGLYGVGFGFALLTLGQLFAEPVLYAGMIDIAPPGLKGTYSGIGAFAEGFGTSAGVLLGGFLFDHFEPPASWTILVAVGVFFLIGFRGLAFARVDGVAPVTRKTAAVASHESSNRVDASESPPT